mmetsp:Transcript_21774/g.39703  ORF Transcript_21774/g.39703 Transcript_21774/m.39703 type:complete len:224 (-) Transcript_21774:85-756(-)
MEVLPKQVIVLRHGERGDRVEKRRRPSFPVADDPALTEFGHSQARTSAHTIQGLIPEGSSVHLVSSPFLRCLETSSHVAEALHTPIHVEEGFGEWLFPGDFDRNPYSDLTYLRLSEPELRRTLRGADWHVNQHIERAKYPESLSKLSGRIQRVLPAYMSRVEADVLIIVTHLYILGEISSILKGRTAPFGEDGYCRLTNAVRRGSRFDLLLENDYSHCPQYGE